MITSPADQFCRRFTFAEIQAATSNFSNRFLIGKGGFGKVYKGIINNGATVVTIKRLDPMSKQGGKELSTEIEMFSKFRHRHVVSLIGYCDNKDEIILVYEYMGNGSLAHHLYEEKSKYGSNSNMSWVQRVKICIEVARGLDYLHTGADEFHRVVHGDVKSSNILLDENWDAKIYDFGISTLVPKEQPFVDTHVKGTFGYLDPEYALSGILTEKSDVYSFGVVLLEALSGRRAVDRTLPEDQWSLVQWGQHCIQEDKTHWLIDPNLEAEIQENSLMAFVKIAGQCLLSHWKERPTMSEVVASLEFALALHKKDSSVFYEDVYDFGETFDNQKAKGSSTIQSDPNSPIGQSKGIEKTSFAEDTSSDESTVHFVDFDKDGLKRKDISLWCGTECHLMNSGLSKLPENINLPVLRELLLQDNYDLSEIPPSFFEFMPALQVLDMSRTSIKYLPPSISNLVELQKLLLRGCKLLMELPAEIRALKNLEVFDLAGTELIYIPKEIEMLSKLKQLEVSLCACADEYISEIKENGEIIPRKTLSKLSHLKELSIFVDPDCEWWYAEVEYIIQDLFSLERLEAVKLYFPTIELLQKFLQLPRVESQSLSNFRLLVGRHDQGIVSRVPRDLQDSFETLEKCLKYVNGDGNIDGIGQALKHAGALFLDRHWTIDRLTTFKANEMDNLRFCLLVECNEMITAIDGGDNGDRSNGGKPILGLLQYLSIHYMKNLESILVGPPASGCLYHLQVLALHTCPKLSIIFNVGLLSNLVNLKELIVEDCPKVESLVSVGPSSLESSEEFLPSLEKISLLHLPGLVSISSGLCVAPRLERMVVYNCPKLQSLSPAEMSSIDIEEIKGESEWWEALEWKSNQPEYLRCVFVPLRRDGLMNQLAEARNSHNTLSMIQNSSKNQEQSEAPKFSNWESEEDAPHTDYLEKASNNRSGAKRKPNDPKANSSSPHSEEPRGQKAPEVVVSSEHERHGGVGPGSSKSESETPKGPNIIKSRHERRPSQEQDDLRRATDSPLRQDAVGQKATVNSPPLLARGISTIDGSNWATRHSTAFDRSIERPPLHPHPSYNARVVDKGGGVSSPSWERKGSAEGSHGVPPTGPGRSRARPASHGDENLDHGGLPVPKFGDWDEHDLTSGEGFTQIFELVREERKSAGRVPITPAVTSLPPHRGRIKKKLKGGCFCFQWGRK
ncbi:hypothetical protein LguiB_006652 [Lonicera macranthoides]